MDMKYKRVPLRKIHTWFHIGNFHMWNRYVELEQFIYEIFMCEIVRWSWNNSYMKFSHMKVSHMKFSYVKSSYGIGTIHVWKFHIWKFHIWKFHIWNFHMWNQFHLWTVPIAHDDFAYEIFRCENNFKNMKSKTPLYVRLFVICKLFLQSQTLTTGKNYISLKIVPIQ